MKAPQIYTVRKTKNRRAGNPSVHEQTGTLPELIQYFSYTLEVGNSWDKKVNMEPKTITSFVNSLQRAYEAQEACCYDRTFVELVPNPQS